MCICIYVYLTCIYIYIYTHTCVYSNQGLAQLAVVRDQGLVEPRESPAEASQGDIRMYVYICVYIYIYIYM